MARFPEDGESVTELLANAAVTLREARAGGGDAVLVTGFEAEADPQSHTFDVFQGLILAVDAKDRYTKRHSEDVARYAMFIGRRMGIAPEDSARCGWPGCSTTSARSGSRTRSCASRAS